MAAKRALRGVVLFFAALVVGMTVTFALSRFADAERTCNYAQEQHRLVGSWFACVRAETFTPENDD